MQQKGSWVYTTRVNLHLNPKSSSDTNVTSVAIYCRGRDGQTVVDEGTTALLSQFIVPQPTTQDPRSMPLTLHPKNHPPIINPTLFDDPAFSPDPLSNPLFPSNHPPSWSLPLGPGHPTLEKRQLINLGEEDFHPPQPPNTPAVPDQDPLDNRTSATRLKPPFSSISSLSTLHNQDYHSHTDTLSSSHSTLPIATTSSALPSSSPASDPLPSKSHVHPKVAMPHDVHPQLHPQVSQQASSSKAESKKRPGFFSRLLGPSSESSASNTGPPSQPLSKTERDMFRMHHPPPQELGLRPNFNPQRHPARSAPEVYRTDRPIMPPRATTVGAPPPDAGKIVSAVAAAAASDRAAEERRLRQDLDRIDELDETNPFGAAVHHGGPYEAISRFVQKDPSIKDFHPIPRIQASGGRNLMMSGEVYRNAQIIALQKGSLKLRPGQILPHDYTPRDEAPHRHPHPHSQTHTHHNRHDDHYNQAQSQPSRHHHTHAQPGAATHEPRRSLERHVPTQMAPSVPQPGPLGNYPGIDNPPPSNPTHSRQRTPSPSAATTHSDEDDAGLAIGMALMAGGQDNSYTASNSTTTAISSSSETNSSPRSSIVKIIPSDYSSDGPSPPPSFHELPEPSSSRTEPEPHRANERRSQGRPPSGQYQREDVPEAPITREPVREPIPQQEFTVQPNQTPVSDLPHPHPYHPSQHPQPPQSLSPYQYLRPPRQEIYSLQPQLTQQHPTPVNPGLSRSSTYAPSSSGQYNDRVALASTLKTSGGTPPSFSTLSLRGRDSDNRSVQQSLMTMSNTSSRSQGGENPRRHRYIPKHLIMPTPLQPTMQNQAMPQRVQFVPQTNPVYSSREPSQSKAKHVSLPPGATRAQNIPMAPANGKLRKRISLMTAIKSSPKEVPPPVAAVSFSANIVSADKAARGSEKANRKVLNKRK